MDINNRLKQIEDLDMFLKEKEEVLTSVLSKLNWTEESLQDELKVPCSRDPSHWIPQSSMSSHEEVCEWVKDGYAKEEMEKQPPSSKFFYQKASSVISLTLNKELQANILSECGLAKDQEQSGKIPNIPKTIDRWTVELNPEQRLAVYDYVVREGKSANKPKHVTVEDLMFDFEKKEEQEGKPKTHLEIMAELRDYKRRRQSYRAKNVHITKKSYTEVMKEVIENQITFLAETRKQENSDNANISEENSTEDKSYTDVDSSLDSKRLDGHHHRSYYDRSRSSSPRRRRHKHDRSRSRSRSRHKHKKSHHKHKKSHE